MDEDWEDNISAAPSVPATVPSTTTTASSSFGVDNVDKNNNQVDANNNFKSSFGFANKFDNKGDQQEGSSNSFRKFNNFNNDNNGGERRFNRNFGDRKDGEDNRGGGFRNRNGFGDNKDGQENRGNFRERRNFGEKKEGEEGGFGGFKRNFGEKKEGEENGGGFRNRGFGERRENNGEGGRGGFGGERKPFGEKRDGDDNRGNFRERRNFGEKKEGEEGGFGGFRRNFGEKKEGEENGGGFRNRSGFGDNKDGQENRSNFRERRNFGEKKEGEEGGFGGFKRNFGEKKEGDDNGRGFRNRGAFGEKKEGEEGGFGGERRNNFGGNRNRDGFGDKDKPAGDGENPDAEKRERYIPADVEDTEENLFHSYATGVNFKKQSEIPVNFQGPNSDKIKPLEKFNEANLSDLLLKNIEKSNYETPTPVQKYAIPTILAKRDLMACAQTGSGKTASYVLPIMTNILHDGIESSELMSIQQPQALILSPTRELALQIFQECKKFSYQSMIKSAIIYGGVDTGYLLRNLSRGCNILVATPGRLLDLLNKGKISLEKVKYFVLDEADRMLDMNFEKDIREILVKGKVHEKGNRNTFMFSATFPKEIQTLAQDFLNDYLFLAVGVVGGANTDVTQTIYKVTKFEKRDKLMDILNDIGNEKTMIFIEHKKQADTLAFFLLQKGYPTTSIHGDRLQSQREAALNEFKTGKSKIIVCTSVAARGLDIEKVNHVINYDLPQSIDEYVHRIGRTGRCGNLGKAISFLDTDSENDRKLARPLVRTLTQAQQEVPEWLTQLAEDSIGTAFTGNACTDDLRNKMSKTSISSAPAAAAAPAQKQDEEEWE